MEFDLADRLGVIGHSPEGLNYHITVLKLSGVKDLLYRFLRSSIIVALFIGFFIGNRRRRKHAHLLSS